MPTVQTILSGVESDAEVQAYLKEHPAAQELARVYAEAVGEAFGNRARLRAELYLDHETGEPTTILRVAAGLPLEATYAAVDAIRARVEQQLDLSEAEEFVLLLPDERASAA